MRDECVCFAELISSVANKIFPRRTTGTHGSHTSRAHESVASVEDPRTASMTLTREGSGREFSRSENLLSGDSPNLLELLNLLKPLNLVNFLKPLNLPKLSFLYLLLERPHTLHCLGSTYSLLQRRKRVFFLHSSSTSSAIS